MSPLSARNQDKYQRTIEKPVNLSGIGIHSGLPSSITLKPAPEDHGIIFITNGARIAATADEVIDTSRGTSLREISVVEHLLSAIYGLGITNLSIEVSGSEIPIMDGSALPFVRALSGAGIAVQTALKKTLQLASKIELSDGNGSIIAVPSDRFKINFMINFEGIGRQEYSFEPAIQSFEKEIAPARTFGYIEELEALKERGLGKGASLDNALVLTKDGYKNTPRFDNEPVRHKILDLIGDLCLSGIYVRAEISAYKSGHKLNIEFAKKLLEVFGC